MFPSFFPFSGPPSSMMFPSFPFGMGMGMGDEARQNEAPNPFTAFSGLFLGPWANMIAPPMGPNTAASGFGTNGFSFGPFGFPFPGATAGVASFGTKDLGHMGSMMFAPPFMGAMVDQTIQTIQHNITMVTDYVMNRSQFPSITGFENSFWNGSLETGPISVSLQNTKGPVAIFMQVMVDQTNRIDRNQEPWSGSDGIAINTAEGPIINQEPIKKTIKDAK